MNLEELLKTQVKKTSVIGEKYLHTPDFRISVQQIIEEGVHVIIHPIDYDGETLDYMVSGDKLTQI